jgi:hypothetical protein
MSQLLIKYSLHYKIVFVLALDFYVYMQIEDDECIYIYMAGIMGALSIQ